MTGATLSMERYELSYDNLVTNENLKALGITEIKKKESTGSSDIGNISHITPTIHPYIGISDCYITGYSRELADDTITPLGHERLLVATLALASFMYIELMKDLFLVIIKNE